MKYEIIMKNHLNLDLIKWFCLLTFLSQVLCHSLHLSGSYQESRVPGRELRKDMDWILKIIHWMSLIVICQETEKRVKTKPGTWRPKKTDVRLCPTHKEEQHAPKHASENFHVCHFVCSSLVAFWMVEITNQSQLGIFTVDWTCLASRGFILLYHLNPFTNDLFACGVSGFPLVLWVSHRGCKESQLAEPSLVCWQRRPCEPQRSFYDYFPYQTWYIFSLLYWLCSYRCCWWTCFVADWLLLFQVSQQANPPPTSCSGSLKLVV